MDEHFDRVAADFFFPAIQTFFQLGAREDGAVAEVSLVSAGFSEDR